MSLWYIRPNRINPYSHYRRHFEKSPLSEVNTAAPVFHVREYLDGTKEAIFHRNIVELLDKVFVRNSMCYLSLDQTRFVQMFIEQAGKVTDYINHGNNRPWEDMDDIMIQFDDYLGDYPRWKQRKCEKDKK